MTLTTGTLYLVGSTPSSSIQYELEGAYTGIGLLEAIALSGESFDSMRDFAGYSACSDTTPATPSDPSPSWIINGVISVAFVKPFNADGIDCDHSTNGSTWGNFYYGYEGSSPLNSSNSCSYTYYRIRAYNCGGTSGWSNGSYAGACPP